MVLGLSAGGSISGGPQEYDLSWHTIDGGGVLGSTEGDFALSGTIGQPDAATMSGGDFELTGGFWFEVIPSDCNEDGVVNLIDYGDFEPCLTGPGGGPLPEECHCFDFDGDDATTLFDFSILQAMFNGR